MSTVLLIILLVLVSYSIYSQIRFNKALKENTELHQQINSMLNSSKIGTTLSSVPKTESVPKLLLTIAECEEQLGGMRKLLVMYVTNLLKDMHNDATLTGRYNYAKLDDIVSALLLLENHKTILSSPNVLHQFQKDVRITFEKLDKEEEAFGVDITAEMAIKIKLFLAEVDRDPDVEFLL